MIWGQRRVEGKRTHKCTRRPSSSPPRAPALISRPRAARSGAAGRRSLIHPLHRPLLNRHIDLGRIQRRQLGTMELAPLVCRVVVAPVREDEEGGRCCSQDAEQEEGVRAARCGGFWWGWCCHFVSLVVEEGERREDEMGSERKRRIGQSGGRPADRLRRAAFSRPLL